MRPDVIVLDPPRKGCEESLLKTIRKLGPDRVVYVSCDSATLARDLKILCMKSEDGSQEASYEIRRVRPCDMFPHSTHIETVVLLSREKVDGHINIDLDVEKLESKSGTATYHEIKDYVEKKHGLNVSSLYIAQIKDKAGLEKQKNYNIGSGEGKVLTCPHEKEEAIMDAFRHFNLI